MLIDWGALSSGFQAALQGMATPAVIALALALTTLLLEDLAIAAGVALAAQGLIGSAAASRWAIWVCTRWAWAPPG